MRRISAILMGLVFLSLSAWELYSGTAFSVKSRGSAQLISIADNELAFYIFVIFKVLVGVGCLTYSFLSNTQN